MDAGAGDDARGGCTTLLRPSDGNSSDYASLLDTGEALSGWTHLVLEPAHHQQTADASCARAGEEQTQAMLTHQREQDEAKWSRRLWHLAWHLGHRSFACEAHAQAAIDLERKALPGASLSP